MMELLYVLIGCSLAGGDVSTLKVYQTTSAMAEFTLVEESGAVPQASFFDFHPRLPIVYAVSEVKESEGRPGGGVYALKIDLASGKLVALGSESSEGIGPCHVAVHPSGKLLVVSNYTGGNIAVLPIDIEGRLGKATDEHTFTGTGGDERRQTKPYAHSTLFSPDGRYAYTQDLGTDRLHAFRVDLEASKLIPLEPAATKVAPGAGPRHLAFHPTLPYAYVINEIDNTLTALAYDAKTGALTPIGSVDARHAGAAGDNAAKPKKAWCADIHVTPDGKFVIGTVRGDDEFVVCAVDPKTGALTVQGHYPTGAKWPRNFTVLPSGAILVANQNSASVAIHAVNPATGEIMDLKRTIAVDKPACVRVFNGVNWEH